MQISEKFLRNKERTNNRSLLGATEVGFGKPVSAEHSVCGCRTISDTNVEEFPPLHDKEVRGRMLALGLYLGNTFTQYLISYPCYSFESLLVFLAPKLKMEKGSAEKDHFFRGENVNRPCFILFRSL